VMKKMIQEEDDDEGIGYVSECRDAEGGLGSPVMTRTRRCA